jgi:elongation factor G
MFERMKSMFKVDVDIDEQKIVYRETIKKTVQAEGKHRKQSGGAGQFGHVWIKFEPSKELFEFLKMYLVEQFLETISLLLKKV